MREVTRRDAVTMAAAAGLSFLGASPAGAGDGEGKEKPLADKHEYVFHPGAKQLVANGHKVPLANASVTRAEFTLAQDRDFYVSVSGSATALRTGVAGLKVLLDVGSIEDVQVYAQSRARVTLIARTQFFESKGNKHWVELAVNDNTVVDEHDRLYVTILPK